MKKLAWLWCLGGLAVLIPSTLAQVAQDFGDRANELRGISSDQLTHPGIPIDALVDPPGGGPVPRPLYLVKRYYSCVPWLKVHVRTVFCDVPGFVAQEGIGYDIDTGNDDPQLQLVNEQNEQRLELHPGTAINHPAYGLYCLKVRICVSYPQWQPTALHQFYVRLAHRHPYVCWWDHWWYYWRSPLYAFVARLDGAQEAPNPVSTPATGAGVLFLDPRSFRLCYDISYSGLLGSYSAAHIHGPAPPGVPAGILHPLNNIPVSSQAGRLFGVTAPYTPAEVADIRNGLHYANIHSSQFSGGEIRGQIQPAPQPVYCPWRPSWIPLLRWGRGGPVWCLTVTHPYCYPWDAWYAARPFCLYGLRYYFTDVVSPRNPASIPFIRQLTLNLQPGPNTTGWLLHPKPVIRYWPFTPYCARWYWWRCTPFSRYRWQPPVVAFATWVNDSDIPGELTDPPDDPLPVPGTTGITTARPQAVQQGDETGDGGVSFFDVFYYLELQGTGSPDLQDVDSQPQFPASPNPQSSPFSGKRLRKSSSYYEQ